MSVGCVIIGAGATGTATTAAGVALADVTLAGLIGLTGDVGFVGLLIDFTHVPDVVCQTLDHTGLPYGSGQLLVCCWTIDPVYPAWQVRF